MLEDAVRTGGNDRKVAFGKVTGLCKIDITVRGDAILFSARNNNTEDSPLTGNSAVLTAAGDGGDNRSCLRVMSRTRPSISPSAGRCVSVEELWLELEGVAILAVPNYHITSAPVSRLRRRVMMLTARPASKFAIIVSI